MNKNIVPTKANLMEIKGQLTFAKKGYELLDKKRTVLIKEMMDLNKQAAKLQETIVTAFKESYDALEDATITMGTQQVYEISKSVPLEENYEILSRSVMGVEIPLIKYEKKKNKGGYSIHKTTTAFDMASFDLNNVKYLIYQLAEVENAVFRLATEIKKTGRRANALDKKLIPEYTQIVKNIENILGEKEREDFFRLGKVKDKKTRKKAKIKNIQTA